MSLDVLFEILRPLKSLSTEIASVRLQWYMDTNMRGDMVALHDRDPATTPRTSEVKVVGALPTDMSFTNMFLTDLSIDAWE